MTSTDLEARWSRRDAIYSDRKTGGESALTMEEVEGVVAWRRMEAKSLSGVEQTKALARLSAWLSPRGRRF